MKTVLMIAPYFVPRRRVGSLRPFKFVIHLKEQGWNPVVLTIKDSKNRLSEKEKRLLDDIQIIEISPPFDRTVSSSSKSEKKKKSDKSTSFKLSEWIDKQIPLDSWMLLFWLKYRGIRKQVKLINPDLIWSTGDPWSGHWMGNKLSKDLSKPWIADFRDPWTLSEMNLRKRSGFSSKRDRHWENKFVKNADKLTFTAKSTEDLYRDHYNLNEKKTATIYNSFDDTLNDSSEKWKVHFDHEYLNILFFGRFRRLSPALPIIKALQSLSSKNPEAVKKIRVHSFGEMEIDDLNRIKKYQLQDQFIIHNPVLPQQSINVFKKADLLLVSTNEARKHIIPAKLWEYLQVEKPILSIAPNPEIADILQETGAGIQFSTHNISEIAQYLNDCVENKNELFLSKRNTGKVDRFTARSTAKQLSKIMDELTSDG
ncbi:MAG: glycosyltransferase [Balneolaceae bacterium]